MAVQTTYADRISNGFAGQVADLGLSNVISREVEGEAGIGFGLAVIRGTTARQVKLGAGGSFAGITVRDVTLDARRLDKYAEKDTAAVLNQGVIWVTAAVAVVFGDPVYRTPTGTLTNVKGTRTATAGAAVGDGNGVMGAITVDATNPPEAGTYTLRITRAVSDAGDFEVIRDRDGALIGIGSVATAFNNGGLSFTLADGSTNYALNTTIPITVVGGNTLIPNANWEASADAAALVKLRLL